MSDPEKTVKAKLSDTVTRDDQEVILEADISENSVDQASNKHERPSSCHPSTDSHVGSENNIISEKDIDPELILSDSPKLLQKSRQTLPFILSVLFSLGWIVAIGFLMINEGRLDKPIDLSLLEDIILLASPVILFWLIALVFQRTDPLLERRLATAQSLDKALAPIDYAETRFDQLAKKLHKEVDNIQAVVSLATDRIENLEGRFQNQVSDLFSATAQAEARAVLIKDTISREREHIDHMASGLTGRLETLETTINQIAVSLTGAEERTALTIDTIDQKMIARIHNIDTVADSMSEKIDRMLSLMNTSTDEFDQLIDKTERRLSAVSSTLLKGVSNFKHEVDGLEGQSYRFSEVFKNQGDMLSNLASETADRAKSIDNTLKANLGEMQSSARDALANAEHVSAIIAERAQSFSGTMTETLGTAEIMATATAQSFADKINSALSASRNLMNDVATQSHQTAQQTANNVSQIHEALMQSTATARETIITLTDVFASEGVKIVEEAQQTGDRTLAHLRQMRSNVEDELSNLDERAASSAAKIETEIVNLNSRATALTDDISNTGSALKVIDQEMSESSKATRDRLAEILEDLSAVEKVLKDRQADLLATSEEASTVIESASGRYKVRIEEIAEETNRSTSRIDKSHDLLLDREQSLRDLTNAMSGDLNKVTDDMLQTTHSIRAELAKTRGDVKEAADDFASRGLALSDTGQRITDRISEASHSLSQESARFKDQSEIAAHSLEQAAEAVRRESEQAEYVMTQAVAKTKEELSTGISGVTAETEDRLDALKTVMQATLKRLLEEYKDNAASAEKESAHLAMRLGSEAVRITSETERFIEKARELDSQLKKSSGENFARTSKLLMQSLMAASVDIHRALAVEISDKDWQAYLDGDQSRFIRKVTSLGDRRTKSQITKQFAENREFKETAIRFMRDFEALMERSMDGDRGDALQVTLISSDMGKLYVLLAQTLKRLA